MNERPPQSPAQDDTDLVEVLRRRAVALRYDHDKESAPRVVGKGQGYQAQRIIEIAEQSGVSVYEDPDLVTMLSTLDVNTEIPATLYAVVAEVLAYVYRINKKAMENLPGGAPR